MPTSNSRIAIFASGNGTNAEAIFHYFRHHPAIQPVLLLSNNPEAYALERAKKFNIPTHVFNREQFRNSTVVLDWLQEKQVTHIVLAGFLWLIPSYLIEKYSGKIINIHPALLPKYGGKGMYGSNVHEEVKKAGDVETGITIHEVNENYDEGKILFQCRCEIRAEDTPEQIANSVHALEYAHYPRVIEEWVMKDH